MPYVSLQLAVDFIAKRLPFQGNSLYGQRIGDRYVVVSYSTPIAFYIPESDSWLVNPNKYSQTTSRHQGVVKRGIAITGKAVDVAPPEMYARGGFGYGYRP